jgi:hypothetical protein
MKNSCRDRLRKKRKISKRCFIEEISDSVSREERNQIASCLLSAYGYYYVSERLCYGEIEALIDGVLLYFSQREADLAEHKECFPCHGKINGQC